MAKLILDNVDIYIGQYNMKGYMNSVGLDYSADVQDVTNFGSGGYREKLAGLKDVSFAHEGYWDEVADEALFNRMALADIPMTLKPDPNSSTAYIARVLEASYNTGGGIGEVMPFSVSGNTNGDGLVRGVMEFSGSGVSASGYSSGSNLGAVSSSQSLFASMHVTSVSGADSTLDVVVESDADNTFASPITVATFAQVGASPSSELIKVAGPITDTWFRISYTVGGTAPLYSFVVSLGIK